MKRKVLLFVLIATQLLYSQPIDPPADDDPVAASINGYVCFMFLFIIFVVFFYFRNNHSYLKDK